MGPMPGRTALLVPLLFASLPSAYFVYNHNPCSADPSLPFIAHAGIQDRGDRPGPPRHPIPPPTTLPLDREARWSLSNAHGFDNVSLDAVAVPTYVLDVLERRGVLDGDPLFGDNERRFAWVAADTWTFAAAWNLTQDQASGGDATAQTGPRALLVLHGVDAAADVVLNGQPLGAIANAHRRHVFDVTGRLDPGPNTLGIRIKSAVAAAAAAAAAYPYPVPYSKMAGGIGQYNFIRKAASDFGWDWGPAFAPSGLSAGVDLILGQASALLADLALRQTHLPNGSVVVIAEAYLRPGAPEEEGELRIEVTRAAAGGGPPRRWSAAAAVRLTAAEAAAEAAAARDERVPAPGDPPFPTGKKESAGWAVRRSVAVEVAPPIDLWWPWDLNPAGPRAPAALYDVTVTYAPAAAAPGAAQTARRRVGLRRVALVRDPIPPPSGADTEAYGDAGGETFRFEVNGVRVWARGANVVPLHAIESRVGPGRAVAAVAAARAAGMNMLRTWGGGRYLGDAFYDACDAAGVLVWQEFAYACALYPRDPPALAEAAEEARQVAARLAGRACVAVWGGNNENEVAFEWFEESMANPSLYAVDYDALFGRTLPRALAAVDPAAIYLDSSPSNGILTEAQAVGGPPGAAGFRVKRWGAAQDPGRGDVHFYDYSSNMLDPETYPRAKFVSEFGYMSLPSAESFGAQAAAGDAAPRGAEMARRMRHPGGLQEIERQLKRHFGCWEAGVLAPLASAGEESGGGCRPDVEVATQPPSQDDAFRAHVYLTQLQQAMVYETAAATWRIAQADPAAATAGLLYWQLNDVWAGPSWAGLNWDGRWKLLHYAAARFFRPLAVFGVAARGGKLAAWVVNDGRDTVEGTLTVEGVPYGATDAAQVAVLVEGKAVTAPATAAVLAWASSLKKAAAAGVNATSYFLRLRFCAGAGEGGDSCSESWRALGELKDAALVPTRVTLSVAPASEQRHGAELPYLKAAAQGRLFPEGAGAGAGCFDVTLAAQGGVALHVAVVSSLAGEFSGNAVMVAPWAPVTLAFCPAAKTSSSGGGGAAAAAEGAPGLEEVRKSLRVTWLRGPDLNEYSAALGVLATTQLAAALFLHALSRGGLSPGVPRLLAALPVLAANIYAPLLFNRATDAVAITLTAFNTAWLSSFKTLLWVLNRSALAAPGVGAAPFAALLLAPLTPVSESGPSQRRRGRLAEAASSPKRMLLDGGAKMVTLAAIAALLHFHSSDFPPVFRTFLYGLALYALLSSIMDGPGAAVSRYLGVAVSPHFDEPWLSTSVASVWNSRWDLAAGNALRQLIYDPLTEGHLLGRPAAPPGQGAAKVAAAAPVGPEPVPNPAIQLLGSFLCFLASGMVHEGIFWYLTGRTSGGRWLSFFLVQAPVAAAERVALRALRARGIELPRLFLNAWTVWFECFAAAHLFFGPAEEAGLVDAVIGNVYTALTGWWK